MCQPRRKPPRPVTSVEGNQMHTQRPAAAGPPRRAAGEAREGHALREACREPPAEVVEYTGPWTPLDGVDCARGAPECPGRSMDACLGACPSPLRSCCPYY